MKLKKLAAFCCSVFCAFSYAVTSVNAATYTNDGITAEIIADNNYLNESDTANVLLKVTNNNNFAVNNISIESIIPDGLKLESTGETSGTVKSLAAGETIRLSVSLASEQLDPVTPDTEVTTSAAETSVTDDGSESANNVTQTVTSAASGSTTTKNTTASGKKQSADSSPKTGEKNGLKILVIAGIIALAILILSSRKRTAKTLSLFLAFSMVGTLADSDLAKALDNDMSFTVSEKIYFGEKAYDLVLKTTYDAISTDPSRRYTRGEWIADAAKIVEIDNSYVMYDEHYDYFYGDTLNTENGLLYEYLNSCGVIPYPDNDGYEDPEQDIPLFEDSKEVTREYAVYSAVKLLGFQDSTDQPQCLDADSLRYPASVSTALKFNMISLENGYFDGNKPLTESEYNQITAVMKAFQRSVYIKNDESVHDVTFVEGVIADELADLTDFTVTDNGNGTYTADLPVNELTSSFTSGTIFVLPACDNFTNGISLKTVSVSSNGNRITVSAVMPEIYEVLTSMAIMDSFQPDPNSFIPAEGITAYLADSAENSGDAAPLDIDVFDIDKEFHPTVPIAISGSFFKDKLEVEGSFSVPEISVIYKTHWEAHLFAKDDYVTDEAMFYVNPKVEANISGVFIDAFDDDDEIWLGSGFLTQAGGMEFDKFSDQFRIGIFPVPLPAGFSVDLNVYLKAEVSGKFTVGFEVDSRLGKHFINGETRDLTKVTPSLSKIELAGEAKFGPKVELALSWTALKDIIGVDIFVGPRIAGALTGHPDAKLLCMDAKAHLFLDLGLSDDTKLGGFLKKHGWELRADLINENNSPLKKSWHFENFKNIVPECTYGNGKLQLHIKDSEGNDIKQAKVTIFKYNGTVDKTLYSDSSGSVTVDGLETGTVSYEVKATGFNKFTDQQIIRNNQTTYAEAIMLVSRADNNTPNGKNTVSGTIKDAATGNIIDASFNIRKGYNASSSADVVFEGKSENGTYSAELPIGYYTITFSRNGYLDNSVNVTIRSSSPTEKNVVISNELEGGENNTSSSYQIPADAQVRIVLTWGAVPEDLDSHLIGSDDPNYHIFYPDEYMNYYSGGYKIANLDVDDTSSFGPETITIYRRREGEILSYYVHDYTNKDYGGKYLSNSGAHVAVYAGTVLVAEFNTPIDVEGTLWHVFDYNPETEEITPVNTYSTIGENDHGNYNVISSH